MQRSNLPPILIFARRYAMPKRTNEFQQLVMRMYKQMAGPGDVEPGLRFFCLIRTSLVRQVASTLYQCAQA